MTSRRTTAALMSLALGTFVMGSAELVVVGVLPRLAGDMAVSISTAGTLVTAYALGICVGGPLLTAATMRFPRRAVLFGALVAYLAATVGLIVASSFGELLVARAVTGSVQGLFIGVAFAIGTSVVPPARMGWAISMVFGGIAVSTALGVPLGTLIGQQFGWRMAFAAITGLGLVALVAALAFVPPVANPGAGGLRTQARFALHPRVLAVLGVGFLVMGGEFATLTYLTPFLERRTGISGGLISVFLLVYGLANVVGTVLGGRAADRDAGLSLIVAIGVLVVALGSLYVVAGIPVLVAVALVLWGVVGFGLVPSLQYRAVSLAGPGAGLASTLPASAVTGGIAVGSLIGGWAVAAHGPAAAVVAGTVICAIALPAAIAIRRLRPAVQPQTAAAVEPAVRSVSG